MLRSYKASEFRVGDKVYQVGSDGSREGLFLVVSVCSRQKYTLSLENGQAAKDGEEINMAKLEAYKHTLNH